MGYTKFHGLELPEEIWDEIENPDWNLQHYFEWKYFVPDNIQKDWSNLSLSEKFIFAYMANKQVE